jgi:hypothetical protein
MDPDPTLHPDGSEIQDYVAMGPTPDLSVSVHKNTFDTMFIIATIIGGLVLLAVVIITVVFALKSAQLPPPPPPLPPSPDTTSIQQNFGAAANARTPLPSLSVPDASEVTTCGPDHHADIKNGQCQCLPPFFGPDCSRERHSKNYFAVGVPNEDTLTMTILAEVESQGKSFNDSRGAGSCSQRCDTTAGCVGFIYHTPNHCTLLGDNVVVPAGESIAYDLHTDSTLYLRNSQNLHFENRVFLGEYTWSLPPRFWLANEASGYLQVPMGVVKHLKFYPTYFLASGSHLGVYSPEPFTSDMIMDIIKLGNTSQSYIHAPDTMLNLPPDWKYKNRLYVAYMPT